MSAPVTIVDPARAYRRSRTLSPIRWRLDGNEGPHPDIEPFLAALRSEGSELLRRYPDVSALEAALARRHGVDPARVLVTAGADEAIDRCCRAYLGAGRTLLVPDPTFEMLERYAALAGSPLVRVPWPPGAFPTAALIERLDTSVGIVAVVSPNNPTGEVVGWEDVCALATVAPDTLLLLDHAYVEYADEDLTARALEFPNAVVTRTFSKAWGLAGCRVGYVIGSAPIVAALRAAGGPYPVAAPAAAFAMLQIETGADDLRAHVEMVRVERAELSARLREHGIAPRRSQANFVYAELGRRAGFVHAALAARGILVREFPDRASLRITLPGDATAFRELTDALDLALAPDALLLDMDGVLADVQESYTACILATTREYGVTLTAADVHACQLEPDSNNDWIVTRRLLAARGIDRPLDEIQDRFQARYLGTPGQPGLREGERAIVSHAQLERLAARLPVGIVTGRPRAEAEWFLERAGLRDLIGTVVALEDAPAKPDPAPVRHALQRLGAQRAWMVGDTPDDVRAANAAGALPLAIEAPGHTGSNEALRRAGAAWILDRLADLGELLP